MRKSVLPRVQSTRARSLGAPLVVQAGANRSQAASSPSRAEASAFSVLRADGRVVSNDVLVWVK